MLGPCRINIWTSKDNGCGDVAVNTRIYPLDRPLARLQHLQTFPVDSASWLLDIIFRNSAFELAQYHLRHTCEIVIIFKVAGVFESCLEYYNLHKLWPNCNLLQIIWHFGYLDPYLTEHERVVVCGLTWLF